MDQVAIGDLVLTGNLTAVSDPSQLHSINYSMKNVSTRLDVLHSNYIMDASRAGQPIQFCYDYDGVWKDVGSFCEASGVPKFM